MVSSAGVSSSGLVVLISVVSEGLLLADFLLAETIFL